MKCIIENSLSCLFLSEEIIFDKVLLKADDGGEGKNPALTVGNPFIDGVVVKGKVLNQGREKKVKIRSN